MLDLCQNRHGWYLNYIIIINYTINGYNLSIYGRLAGLLKTCLGSVCRGAGVTPNWKFVGWRDAWLEHPQGWSCSSSREAQLILLGSLARLGLAWWLSTKQCFGQLPIMYTVTGLISHLTINNEKEASIYCKKTYTQIRCCLLRPNYLSDGKHVRVNCQKNL